jgi:uncharacterized membrane protein
MRTYDAAISEGRLPSSPFAALLGIFFLIEGVWGFFSPVVFGILSTNMLHATIHVLLGVVGLWVARNGRSHGYAIGVGLLLLVVGILWFVPGANELVVKLFNVNRAVAILNVVVGALGLIVASVDRSARAGI